MIVHSDKEFYISEIFESIQGEGNNAGMNSLFIRFHFCNLTCPWCDTKYTWDKNDNAYTIHTKKEIQNIITGSKKNEIILTGGEPALYKLDEFISPGIRFHVETNGTFIPLEKLNTTIHRGITFKRNAMNEKIIREFNWIVSPKLSNSGQEPNKDTMLFWASKEYASFKFIARNSGDIKEINEAVDSFGINKTRTYIGVEGITRKSQMNLPLIDEILKNGYHYSPRLHILLWGNKKGK
jgi:organic radical activating enzyme